LRGLKALLYGIDERVKVRYKSQNINALVNHRWEGVMPLLERRARETKSEAQREFYRRFMAEKVCSDCNGLRLRAESMAVTIGGKNIVELTGMTVAAALDFIGQYQLEVDTDASVRPIFRPIHREVSRRLQFLINVGLQYLTLDRTAGTLSSGEGQRIRLATQLGSALVGVLYILDEPSIGLHPRDNNRLLKALRTLQQLGNTVLVIEHDETTLREADHVIELGPGAGERGGQLVAQGTALAITKNRRSLTGAYLVGRKQVFQRKLVAAQPEQFLTVEGAVLHNLKNINVDFPLGRFSCLTGVSGSGKSTLLNEVLYPCLKRKLLHTRLPAGKCREITNWHLINKIIDVDQSPIGRTPRSNPATYTGMFTPIRQLFSQVEESRLRGYKPGRFSFNVKGGRCETCEGAGTLRIEMHFLPEVYITCHTCKGQRYNRDTLEVRFKGYNIAEILAMTVSQALALFKNQPVIYSKLDTLNRVGLGYIRLGQPATTLSGGEAQRVKLATELSKRSTGRTLYILDEPTTGLHFADIDKLVRVLDELVEKGNTVVVIEHNLDVIRNADWLIDLGPEGGDKGGQVVVAGPLKTVMKHKKSYTAKALRAHLSNRAQKKSKKTK